MMGGEVTVKSQLGRGSIFSFSVNLELQTTQEIDYVEHATVLQGLKVLVVENHPPTLEFLYSTLRSFSFQVTTSTSTQEGLARLEESRAERQFKLVILGSSLPPVLDMRNLFSPLTTSTPLLLLKNEHDPINPDLDRLAKATLIKPVTRSHLFDTIMQIFGRQAALHIPDNSLLPAEQLDQLKGKRALLVEDNEINQLVAVDLLEGMGMIVSVAENGEQAIQMATTGAYQVVLMDIQMPGMDGYQATAQIRSDPRFSFERLPIIAMTAHALIGDREKTLAAGLNDHVSKPVDVGQLTSVLFRWLVREPADKPAQNKPVSAADSSDNRPLPDSLEYIDMDGALARLGGNQKLYLQLLLLFCQNQGGAVNETRAALQVNDFELAKRLAHTLRGVAGTIGANELALAAKALETAIAENNMHQIQDDLERVRQNLGLVLGSIASLAVST
jgi:CheY-like chemotaxis protein